MSKQDFILKMEGISKSFPGVHALQNVNFELKKGEVHALLGENGAGKSTLLKIIAGAYSKDAGEIYIDGQEVEELTPKKAEQLGISIIYQEFSSLPHLSIAENIFLGRLPIKKGLVDWKSCYEQSRKLLKQVGLDSDPKMLVSQLKVAQQQMVEIAKALSKEAKIIIMDEPTAPLTQREIDSLFKVILDLREKGVSVVYVSHRLIEIKEICDIVTVLRDGTYVGKADVCDIEIDDMIRMMVGREISDMYPRSVAKIGEPLLEVTNLCTEDKLNDINFNARKGEILGIAGLVGSGRTELARAIYGADSISSGSIILDGKTLDISCPADAIRNKIGLVPEDRKNQGLVLMMNIKDNISLASLSNFMKAGKLNLNKEENTANHYVNKLGIVTPGVFEEVNNLSGGNQQKVVLGKWMCTDCNLLIIDEPTRGIDVGAKVEIYELINELVEQGAGVIMISSDLPELIGVCDRILVMHEGRLSGELNRKEFCEEKIMRYATGQIDAKKIS